MYPDVLERAGYEVGFTGKGWGPGNWQISGRRRNPAGVHFSSIRTKSGAPGISPVDYAANFREFLKGRLPEAPFCFWYGAHEPHRVYDPGSGRKSGKRVEDVEVPSFLPDTEQVRSDILDYLYEVEWFDRHLGRMIELLDAEGLAENTLLVVTSDNGFSFPRAKANLYEYSIHLPLAVRWPGRVKGGRTSDALVSFVDFAPTFLEAAGVPAVRGLAGRSLLPLLAQSDGTERRGNAWVLCGRERHSHARFDNLGYPVRAIQDTMNVRQSNGPTARRMRRLRRRSPGLSWRAAGLQPGAWAKIEFTRVRERIKYEKTNSIRHRIPRNGPAA